MKRIRERPRAWLRDSARWNRCRARWTRWRSAQGSPASSASTAGQETELCSAHGYADRAHGIAHPVETLFATASGTKGLTALPDDDDC